MDRNPELKPNMIIYLDDVLIASEDMQSHAIHLKKVLESLQKAGFKLKGKKCVFAAKDIRFLGHEIDSHHIKMSDETKNNIAAFPVPKNKKQIQAFLGLVNWDRRFVPNLTEMTRPLEKILQKTEKFKWTNQEQKTFQDIKRAFVEAETLAIIDPELDFGLDTDASTIGLGARLYQFDKNEQQRTIAYASRSLRPAETRYTITELEGLALVWALRKWIVLLAGRRVRVNTDHKALIFITSCANTSQRIARWTAFLQEFNLDIRHIPEQRNNIADTLSRYPIKENSQENEEVTVKINTSKHNEQMWKICPLPIEKEQFKTEKELDKIKTYEIVHGTMDKPQEEIKTNTIVHGQVDNPQNKTEIHKIVQRQVDISKNKKSFFKSIETQANHGKSEWNNDLDNENICGKRKEHEGRWKNFNSLQRRRRKQRRSNKQERKEQDKTVDNEQGTAMIFEENRTLIGRQIRSSKETFAE